MHKIFPWLLSFSGLLAGPSFALPSPIRDTIPDGRPSRGLSNRDSSKQSAPTTSQFTQTSQLNITSLGSPVDGDVVKWEDWAFGGKDYREPSTTISDGRSFALSMLTSVQESFRRSGAHKRDIFPGGSTFFFARPGQEQGYNLRFRLVSNAPDQTELDWEEVIKAAEGFYRWTEDWDTGRIPSCDLVLIDYWQFIGVQTGEGTFTVLNTVTANLTTS